MKQTLASFIFRHHWTRILFQEWQVLPGRTFLQGWSADRRWSESDEDDVLLSLARELGVLESGYYVDVGANLPTKRSNTFRLYCNGMRGITIEPNLELAALHERIRPEDELVSVAVGSRRGIARLQRFNYHVFSTCSTAEASRRREQTGGAMRTEFVRSSCVAMLSLGEIIAEIKGESDETFFLLKSDTEGLDFEVLQSNDWERYQPYCVLTESTGQDEEVSSFLDKKGYCKFREFRSNQLYLRNELFEKIKK